MKKALVCALIYFSGSVFAETINITCFDENSGKRVAHNWTIVSGASGSKGKVFGDDKDLDSVTSSSTQSVNNVVISPSIISYGVHFYSAPEVIGNRSYGAGTVDIQVSISRVDGLKNQSTNTQGGMMGEAEGIGTKYTQEHCEPRRTNKF